MDSSRVSTSFVTAKVILEDMASWNLRIKTILYPHTKVQMAAKSTAGGLLSTMKEVLFNFIQADQPLDGGPEDLAVVLETADSPKLN